MKKSELKEIIKECVREVMSKEPLQEASKYRKLQSISIRGKNNEFAIGETGLSGKTMFSCEIAIQPQLSGFGKSEQEAIDNAVKKTENRIKVLQDLKKKLSSMKPKKLEESSYKPSKPKWYKDNMPVVIVGLKTGVERYKNFADAKRKHKDLELYDASKKSRFTTAMYDKDKGKPVARFETWEAYNRMSM
jgi:hypothetical protein